MPTSQGYHEKWLELKMERIWQRRTSLEVQWLRIHADPCTPMFTAALFTIARTWKQPRCPSADEWIRKLWYIYTMEYDSAIKKNSFESVLMRWMKLEPIIWLSDFTFTFHFHALEKEMTTHSSVLAWRIPGTEEPGGLSSIGSHGVRHDWSNLAAAAYRVK